jgi:hypothetical protein
MSTQSENPQSQSPCCKYKYLTAERLKNIIESGKIHFAKPDNLNDPFEMPSYMRLGSPETDKSRVDKFVKKLKSIPNYLKELHDSYYATIKVIGSRPTRKIYESYLFFWWDFCEYFK